MNVGKIVRYIPADSTARKLLVNVGGDTCYYKSTADVSSGSNDGSLAEGEEHEAQAGTYVISASETRLALIDMPTPIMMVSMSSLDADEVVVEDPTKETVVDMIDGVEVAPGGRLEISYLALYKQEEFLEEGDNKGNLSIYLDDDPILQTPDEESIGVEFFDSNTEHWQGVHTSAGELTSYLSTGEDAPASGPFLGASFLSIAAGPGIHQLSVRVKPGEPEGGKIMLKQRRFIALTEKAC